MVSILDVTFLFFQNFAPTQSFTPGCPAPEFQVKTHKIGLVCFQMIFLVGKKHKFKNSPY